LMVVHPTSAATQTASMYFVMIQYTQFGLW